MTAIKHRGLTKNLSAFQDLHHPAPPIASVNRELYIARKNDKKPLGLLARMADMLAPPDMLDPSLRKQPLNILSR
jgi:hypothetical protein